MSHDQLNLHIQCYMRMPMHISIYILLYVLYEDAHVYISIYTVINMSDMKIALL